MDVTETRFAPTALIADHAHTFANSPPIERLVGHGRKKVAFACSAADKVRKRVILALLESTLLAVGGGSDDENTLGTGIVKVEREAT